MSDTIAPAGKQRTITLTGRAPVQIRAAARPTLALASGTSCTGDPRVQANRGVGGACGLSVFIIRACLADLLPEEL